MKARKLLCALAAPLALAALPFSASAQSIIRDAEIEAILREYSDPLFEAAGLQPSDVNIYLLNDNSINAGVSGGQNMGINTGLILAADNAEMLKGVIAHETGHIAGGHNVTRQGAMSAGGGVSLISIGLGVLAIAAGAPDAGMALIGSAQGFGMLTTFKYIRYEELSADQYGIGFLEKTGQSAQGMLDFFEKFRNEELMSERRREPYFRTHPIASDRIGIIRRRVAEVTGKAKPQDPKTVEQFKMMQAKLVGYLSSPAKVANKYPATDKSLPALYARAHAAYRVHDIKTALADAEALIAAEPENPYFYELKGMILFESGKTVESIEPYRKSVQFAGNQPLLLTSLARSLIEAGGEQNYKDAEDLLVVAVSREKDNAYAWNQLSHVYSKTGRIGDADLAVAEEAYAVGNMSRAQIFAMRAAQALDPETVNGRRALDIGALSDPKLNRARGRRG